MSSYKVDVLEREEIKLVGFTIVESLNHVIETQIGGKLRESLETRRSEVQGRIGSGMYLIQVYPQDGHWTPDVPYLHIFAYGVETFEEVPGDMVTYSLPAGRYTRIVHEGAESRIGETYEFINQTFGHRPIDIEYWHDIHTLEDEYNRIDIYIPSVGG